jgi:hypothetical protein
MKMREYGTDIISHENCYKNTCEKQHSKVRNTDTYKSKVLEQTTINFPERVLSRMIQPSKFTPSAER